MKNPILAVILLVCNFSLFLLDHYSVFVFMTLCLLIAITVSVRLLASKKIIISLGFFILFYTLLNVFSFWLNPPQWFGYYLIISFTKMFLYVGLLWAYLSVNRHYFDTKIKNYINQSSKIKTNSRQFSCIHIGIIALVLCIIYGIYFVAFSPGNMYIDSYSQWGQAMGGIPLDDWHPVFSTLLLRVSYKLIGTPAIFTLFQVVASIAVFTYLSYILLKRNVRPLLVYFFVFFLMFATVTIPSMVTIYKDNIYNIAILFLVLFLYESVDSKGKWLREKWFHSIALAVAFIFVMLSRHNGIYVVIASLLLIILFSKNLRLYFLGMLSFLMVVNWLYTGPLFSYYEVESGSPSEKYSILLQQIGSVIAYDGEITSEEEEFLNQILPLDTWKEKYTESMADPVKFHVDYNREAINNNEIKFLFTWWQIFKRNPLLSIKGHIEQIRPLWDINGWEHGLPGSVMYHFMIDSPKEFYDPYLQEYSFDVPELRNAIEVYSYHINEYNMQTKPFATTLSALSIFCLIGSSILLFTQKKGIYVLALVPAFINLGTLIIAMPAYNMRYVMSFVYIGLFSLFIPILSLKLSKQEKMEEK